MRRQRGKYDYSAKFCKGNYSSVAAGASTIKPPAPSPPPIYLILRHKQARKCGHICHNTHLYIKYIRTHQNKPAHLHLALSFRLCRTCTNPSLRPPPSLEKHRQAPSPSDTDPHMISPQCSERSGRSCSRRGNSVSVCSTEKKGGEDRSKKCVCVCVRRWCVNLT